jgi:hypothetical protein
MSGESAGVQHDQADLGDVGLLGVCDRDLFAGGGEQCRGGPGERGGVLGPEFHSHVGGVRHDVELAAEGDVRGDGAVLRHDDLPVQGRRERRHVAHPDPPHPTALDPGSRLHQTDGGVDPDHRLRLGHGQAAGLQQRGDGAHGVGARHRPEATLLQDDDADVGGGVQRRQHEHPAHRRIAPGLTQHQAAQPLQFRLAPAHPLGPGGAPHEEVGADQDPSDLALGVHVDRRDRSGPGERRVHHALRL